MRIQKSLWLLIFLFLTAAQLQAERIFIMFDQTCMDRLEYKQAGQPGSYVVYQVNVAPGERILLEVGQESGEYRGNMPSPLIGCSTGIFDAQMVEKINRGIDEIFMIKNLANGRHTITQVSLAASYQYNPRMIAFDSPKYQFRFDLENGTIGENIAASGTQRQVFFEGRLEEQCLGAYIFRQLAPRSAKPHMDLVLIPGVGIIEEKAGFTLDEALSNALKLENINGVSLANRLQQLCNQQGTAAASNLILTPYNSDVTPGRVFNEQPDMSVKNPNQASTASASAATGASGAARTAAAMHDIKAGETLYAISKKYGVTVNQLKAWNGLNSNTIYKGRQLIVSDPSQAGAAATGATTTKTAALSPPNSGNNMAAPYEETGRRIDVAAKGGAAADQYHIVRTGETVASIALKYGYTEARFREMNGLKANEYPKIGQQLKISDCDCPEATPNALENSSLNARSVNPYAPGPVPVNNRLETPATSAPVNNYSFPAPSAYDNSGQTVNTNSRPFSSYNDTPVPATGSSTAPINYNNSPYNSGNTYGNPAGQTNYNQPTDYSNTGNTNLRGLNDYNANSYQPSGVKRSHLVKDGETLYDIARLYGTTVEKIRQLNRMDPTDIVIPNQRVYLE